MQGRGWGPAVQGGAGLEVDIWSGGGGCRDDFSRWALGSAPSRDTTFINTQP